MMIWNQIKTILLLGALSGLLLFLGSLIGGAAGLQIAFILALVMNGITYFYSDKIVLKMYGAKPLDRERYSTIYRDVEALTQSMQLPMPKLWLVDSPMANAFATGRDPQHASVAVTTGILQLLDERELRGVLAHELGHVKNRDTLITTIAATMATAIGYLAHMLQYAAFWGSMQQDDRRKGNPIFMLLVAMLMPIAATLVQLAISRSREYLADETGARCCKDPLSLARALEKLDGQARYARRQDDPRYAATESLFIVHPIHQDGLMNLFSTHPPVYRRVAKLRTLADELF
jgi:heat shock protein HtpX